MTQTIESTATIKFLTAQAEQAAGVGKKEKAKALTRAREIVYNYYLSQEGFVPEADESIFG